MRIVPGLVYMVREAVKHTQGHCVWTNMRIVPGLVYIKAVKYTHRLVCLTLYGKEVTWLRGYHGCWRQCLISLETFYK